MERIFSTLALVVSAIALTLVLTTIDRGRSEVDQTLPSVDPAQFERGAPTTPATIAADQIDSPSTPSSSPLSLIHI